jgi:hypothetical protein
MEDRTLGGKFIFFLKNRLDEMKKSSIFGRKLKTYYPTKVTILPHHD